MTRRFPRFMQRHVANVAIGASTARRAGAPGAVKAARSFLADLDLRDFSHASSFEERLDVETERLRMALPKGARHWGLARKLLNIFLRDATYNHHLRTQFGLGSIEPLLEIPLDSFTQRHLKRLFPSRKLPRWRGVNMVTPEENAEFQAFAKCWHDEFDAENRVELDTHFWRQVP